jgi:drug/metabolite transporter (DMT)-like permease
MPRKAWIAITALAALWGASYLFIKIGLRSFSPEMVVFLRTALAALVLLPPALSRGVLRNLPVRDIVVLAAIQVAAPFLLISLGERSISSSLAGILVASTPIFNALIAIRIDQEERVSGWGIVGVGVGIVGVGLVVGVDVGGSGLLGALAVVLASLGYAIGSFFLKRRLRGVPALGVASGTMIASAAMVAPAAIATFPSAAPHAGPVLAIVALGCGGTGLAFVIFYWLIARVGPTKASLVTYIAPGFAVLYGVSLLNEKFTPATAAGLVLIVGGSWLAAEGRSPEPRRVAAARGTSSG